MAKKLQEFVKTTFYVSRGTICGLNFFLSFESFRIFCRNLWHGSQKSFYVSRVKIAEELFFFLPFWFCSDFERKIFQTFGQKTSWICQNYLLRVHSNNLWLEIFFLSFESFRIFCRNLWHGSSKIYPSVQSKNCGLNRFFVFLFRFFFEFWAKNFLDFRPKNFKKLWKLNSACPQEQLEALNFFKKIWTVLNFLQKPLAWFSKIYLRVQSKICGRIIFFLPFWFCSDFERKIFQTFGQKTSWICQNYLLRVHSNNLWLEFFFLSFESFRIFCRKLWHGSSKIYPSVQSKICGRNIFFYSSFLNFFGFWAKNFPDFWPKNFKNLSKLPSTCPEEQFVAWIFFLSFESFRIFCRNLWHGSQKSFYVSRVKIAEELFFFLPFWFCSDFERKIFQTFGQKTSWICQNYLLRVHSNNLWLEIFF